LKTAYILPNIIGTGGIAKVIFAKIDYLIENFNYDITIITYMNIEKKSAYTINKNVKFIHLNLDSNKNLKSVLSNVLKENKFDIVISSLSNNEFYFINSIKDGSKKIAEFHTCFDYIKGFTSKRENFLKYIKEKISFYKFILAAKKFNAFVVLNNIDKVSFSKYLKNIEVISNPIIHSSEIAKCDFRSKKIIAAGRLEGVKGFEYLVEAWGKINSKFPDWSVSIYGEGPLESELKSQIKNNNIKNISIYPFDKNIDKHYKDSSILVLTSMFEGQGMVLLEAMHYGLSLVSFKIKSGPLELVKDNKNGFLVKKKSTSELAEKIETLITDENLREKFHYNSIEFSKEYSIEKIMKKWNHLFKNL
jgi:glycosyltransferase involved in cell wall biosynthesis